MALTEIVIFTVGPAIAKGILKIWLKDQKIAAEIGSALIDLLKQKTKDEIAQQKGRRQFEEIGEKIAESLLILFESEGTNLTEGGKVSVALMVAETLDKSAITPALLAERNLEPTS